MISGLVQPMVRGMVSGVIAGGANGVVPFAYEPEAETFFAVALADGVEPTTTRKRTYNRLIKRLKTKGVWDKISALYLLCAATEAISFINVKSPSTYKIIKVGAPTFTANDGWRSTAGGTADYLNTTIPLNTVSRNDHSMGVYSYTATAVGAADFGASNASNIGIHIGTKSSSNFVAVRSFSGSTTVGATTDTDGSGFFAFSRSSATGYTGNRAGYNFATTTQSTTAATEATEIYILKANLPGALQSGHKLGLAFLGTSMTETNLRDLYAAFIEYQEAVQFGEFYEEEVGIGTTNITADVIIYGATSGALTAAYEATRQGKTVAICGGWRDRRVGGMSAGGLGATDFNNHASLGGLPRWVLTKVNSLYSRADTTFAFESRIWSRAIRFLMNSAVNGGYTMPVYYTRGVISVSKTGTTINSFRTGDGRTFTGSVFIDASYEGDLAVLSGITMTKGREAAGTGKEVLNGYRGIITTNAGNNHQFKVGAALVNVDPYVTPATPASGLLNGISRTYTAGTPAIGSADDEIQAYNFRMTLNTITTLRTPFPSTPPTGYSASDWEPLGRLMAANPTVNLSDLFLVNTVGPGSTTDINSKNGWSTDFWGGSKNYPSANYAAREVLWKAHWNRILGLFYYLQYDPDSRVLAGVRASALAYGFENRHYCDGIHENDSVFTSPQMYVREAWRMVGPLTWDGNDIAATDGTTPRSTKTIAAASYAMDSHSTEAIADANAGSPRIWCSGNFEDQLVGDQTAPIPYEIITPNAAECTNLFVIFAVSATHVAFGSIRMELTFMQMGQSAGLAAVHAINDGVTVQNVNYANLRTALLASPTLSGEVAPVLPVVN